VKSFSSWAEFAVGGSLIAIGALGINEARNWKAEDVPMELAPSEVFNRSTILLRVSVLLTNVHYLVVVEAASAATL
jgi:hypothetical protein